MYAQPTITHLACSVFSTRHTARKCEKKRNDRVLLFTRSKKAALFFASSVTSFLFSFPFFSPLLQFQKRWKGGRGEERRRIVGANTNTKPRTGAGRIARRTAFSRSRVAYDRKYRRFPARRPARKVGIFRNYRGRERSTESTSTPLPPVPEADEGNLEGEEETRYTLWTYRKSGGGNVVRIPLDHFG